jgi:hypothetical protein
MTSVRLSGELLDTCRIALQQLEYVGDDKTAFAGAAYDPRCFPSRMARVGSDANRGPIRCLAPAAWTAWKDRMHDVALPLPTQRADGIARCFYGEVVTSRTAAHPASKKARHSRRA